MNNQKRYYVLYAKTYLGQLDGEDLNLYETGPERWIDDGDLILAALAGQRWVDADLADNHKARYGAWLDNQRRPPHLRSAGILRFAKP